MTDIDTDVLVVGGGPAGAIAAYYASEEGANVLLIDKKKEIGVPVRCGEGLPMTVFEDFGLPKSRKWIANQGRFLRVVSPKGKSYELEPHIVPCVLNRDKFEQMLVDRAQKKGVKVMLRTTASGAKISKGKVRSVRVHIDDDDGTRTFNIRPKVVVGADGVESRVGRWMGIDTKVSLKDIASCAQNRVKDRSIEDDTLEFWLGEAYARHGYAWVFPKGKKVANIGIGMIPEKHERAPDVLEGFLDIRAKDGKRSGFTVGCIPMSRPIAQSVKGNLMLVGDSAHMVHPVTGAGIANAFIAGRIAGRHAGRVASGKKGLEHLEEYDVRWRRILEKKLLKCYKMKEKYAMSDKKINRFMRLARMAFAFYKLSPRTFGPILLGGYYYTGGEDD